MNGPLGSATKNVSIIGMNTTVEEITNYQDQDQEVAKNFPTSMEPIQQNILNHIIGNNDNKYMGFYSFLLDRCENILQSQSERGCHHLNQVWCK